MRDGDTYVTPDACTVEEPVNETDDDGVKPAPLMATVAVPDDGSSPGSTAVTAMREESVRSVHSVATALSTTR